MIFLLLLLVCVLNTIQPTRATKRQGLSSNSCQHVQFEHFLTIRHKPCRIFHLLTYGIQHSSTSASIPKSDSCMPWPQSRCGTCTLPEPPILLRECNLAYYKWLYCAVACMHDITPLTLVAPTIISAYVPRTISSFPCTFGKGHDGMHLQYLQDMVHNSAALLQDETLNILTAPIVVMLQDRLPLNLGSPPASATSLVFRKGQAGFTPFL